MYIKIIDVIAMTNPKVEAVAIDFFISSIKNDIYGTDNVPPPMPMSELIVPFLSLIHI